MYYKNINMGGLEMKVHKIGIIGAGMRAMFLVDEILKRDDFEIVAISDVSQHSMDQICDVYDKEWDQYLNYKDLLEIDEIEGVIILSPDYIHEEQAIAAFEAGKHVFLEKPIATTIDGGKRVIEKRDESGKTLLIGFVLRYNKQFAKMKEIVDSGLIGDIKTGWILHSVGMGSDWYFHDWHGTMANTGGLLLQKGSHDFDIINWISESRPKRISGFGNRNFFGGDKANDLTCQECDKRYTCTEAIVKKDITWKRFDGKQTEVHYNQWRNQCAFRQEIDVLDDHHVLIEYENGINVTYTECHYTPDDNREYIFIGTKGKLTLDNAKDTITVQLRHNMHDRYEEIVYSNLQSSGGHGGGDTNILNDFAYGLTTGNQPNAGGEAGLEAISVGLLAHKSINEGKVIEYHK